MVLGHALPFVGQEVVVTEKLDGENTTLYRRGLHARSLDPRPHPSRDWVKRLQGQIGHLIPEGWRVCGENLYARHSLGYDDLESGCISLSWGRKSAMAERIECEWSVTIAPKGSQRGHPTCART